jgi:hypothetical protein
VRGDSLRDLYAKVMALFGLGLLACAGAVVDYWPVAGDVPRVAKATGRLSALPAAPTPAGIEIPAPVLSLSTATTTPSRRALATAAEPAPVELFISLAAPDSPSLREPIELAAPPAVELAPIPAVEAPASEIALARPAPVQEPLPGTPTPTRQMVTNPPIDGFFTGALKKTGASIVKTGAATGASIVDAFRGMFGAFKKVSPFSPDSSLS